jgi:D-beta-D-heptose 7-phosphate kinase/D-beta-D-heptose 1-phosphate adenosyltransferase
VPEHLVIVGDALLDRDVEGAAERLAPDAPVPVVHDPVVRSRPGGAGLAALLAARAGSAVTLVTALGDDRAGRELDALLTAEGVTVVDLERRTTPVKTRVRVDGHSLLRLDQHDGDEVVRVADAVDDVDPDDADAVLIADYGRGVADHPVVRRRVREWAARRPLVWDPHPRGTGPVPGARLVTPNRAEARAAGLAVDSVGSVAAAAATLAGRWFAQGVAVTLGAEGAVLGVPGRLPLAVPAPRVVMADPCGAGDCLAVHATIAIARGAVLTEAVTDAVVAASAFVAEGGVAALHEAAAACGGDVDRIESVRRRGGTVVATSGCFDLLHAGHVAMLESARALGDALVVLLNSDRSVQDLKGAERPIVREQDRAALLRSLRCVDAVELFDEVTPVRALEQLRPSLFVKGDDYGAGDIPEREALAHWGGAVVVVPYLEGRSTTRLIEEVHREV